MALVTSAGGLEALSAVLGGLAADLPAALVVAQHQDPEGPGLLAGILAARTRLRVRVADDGDLLEVGTVLVTPPARHLIVTSAGEVGLLETGDLPPSRPSADMLLATLAATCGPRVLTVVLTGKGHDAQAGIRAVHRCGGAVFAQDEASSAYFGMPGAAVRTGLVQRTLALDELASAIGVHVALTR
ncbi:chemotaxis protein CheB [Pseudonocardia humida]|uniref:chemotaxis protein CheB n=1 Tax=Pseudonocardia humida TaxID=2800819 RepID=UPI00207C5F0F|nr:chemotaxis protein CheB [Pseudonocardia humida]